MRELEPFEAAHAASRNGSALEAVRWRSLRPFAAAIADDEGRGRVFIGTMLVSANAVAEATDHGPKGAAGVCLRVAGKGRPGWAGR